MRHVPRKRFGQHFLTDRAVIDRIVGTIDPRPDEQLIEIGPGHGALPRPLLERGTRLTVVELDRDLLADLVTLQSEFPGLEIRHQDALTLELAEVTRTKIRIAGNLPYNISGPLLFHLFEQSDRIEEMVFMLQKEVVDRICAAPGDSEYGRLSVMAQFYCEAERHFDVEPACFSPPPKVMSSVFSLRPRVLAPGLDTKLFAGLVQQAFSQRRKMLRNTLSGWLAAEDFRSLAIDPSQRAQELDLQAFMAIYRYLVQRGSGNDGA